MPTQITGPKGYPIVGNLMEVQGQIIIEAFRRLGKLHGPIFKLKMGGEDNYFCVSHDLFDELCDETRFYKKTVSAISADLPKGKTRGLFSSDTEKDIDWAQAHRILMPAFGPMAIEGMFDEMYDLATQLAMKWGRKDPGSKTLATDDFTRLTLDTIALCAMDYRFNSFYTEGVDPYVQAMNVNLTHRSKRGQLSNMIDRMKPSYQAGITQSFEYLNDRGMELVQRRRENPSDKKDILNAMINGKDPKTDEGMRDDLIAANMETFLVAGHETTSGLLSFAVMRMLLNPSTYFTAQQEVDRVIGTENIQAHHLKELKYVDAVLKETIRLHPTAPAFGRAVRPENKEEHVYIGKEQYEIPRDAVVMCLLDQIQSDPKVWGPDSEEFKPERMLDENFDKLPKNAWKPFGTGVRSCIGRAFAQQEALLVTAMVLQNFDLSLDDPNYRMHIQQALTIKPKDCYIRTKLRDGLTAQSLQDRLNGRKSGEEDKKAVVKTNGAAVEGDLQPMTILYGSNTGTCQAMAQKLAAEAASQGFSATMKDMDDGVNLSPAESNPLVVITASYEGEPPDNANHFVAWIKSLKSEKKPLKDTRFAVFGCGHRDWSATFQKIPTVVDDLLAANGATRITERGVSDASRKNMGGDFDTWSNEKLWPALASSEGGAKRAIKPKMPAMDFSISQEQREDHLQQKSQWAEVIESKTLTAPGGSEKRHIEFKLPEGMHYNAGDYLAVLPLNPEPTVLRVQKRFGLPADGMITINKGASTTLPTGMPISIGRLLGGYVELSQPATKKELELILETVQDESEGEKLLSFTQEPGFTEHIVERRASILDILESTVPSSNIGFASFLALLPPLKQRHYSISSSPYLDPERCSLTYSVIDEPTWVDSSKKFVGVAGGYLRTLDKGSKALVSVRSSNVHFRPPVDPENTPMIMLCAGSGLAPFRGFLQERAAMIRDAGRKLAPAILFLGCRSATTDRIYAEEIDQYVGEGIVDVRYAFSRDPDHELAHGCTRVQARLLKDRTNVVDLFKQGAKVYVCGSGDVLRELKTAARKILVDAAMHKGEAMTHEEAEAWFAKNHNDRFVADVFQ